MIDEVIKTYIKDNLRLCLNEYGDAYQGKHRVITLWFGDKIISTIPLDVHE